MEVPVSAAVELEELVLNLTFVPEALNRRWTDSEGSSLDTQD